MGLVPIAALEPTTTVRSRRKWGMNTRTMEVGLMRSGDDPSHDWIKSSFSTHNGNCVEVAGLAGGTIRVRDSKNPRGGVLNFTTANWDAFIGGVRTGEFDCKPRNP